MTHIHMPMRQTHRPLKVLLAHELFPPDFAGGGEYVVGEIAQHLQAIGHRVTVVTTGDPLVMQYLGIRTVRLPISRYRLNLAWRQIADLAREADLIHAFTYHALYPAIRAGKLLGKPVVGGVLAQFGDVWLEMRGQLAGRLWRQVERYLLGLPFDIKLHLSEFSQVLARDIGVDRPGDRIVVPGITHKQYYALDDKSYVLFTGKLDVRKGIYVVLDVARQLPDVPFRIIGWGEGYDNVAAAAPSNVRMERRRESRLHYLEALAGARIFLFPTKAETFGLVIPEAMASGCAIVSTSPLPFEGLRVHPDDVAGTSEAVRALWDDPVLCSRHGKSNQQIAQQYDWEKHVNELENVYWQVMDTYQGKS